MADAKRPDTSHLESGEFRAMVREVCRRMERELIRHERDAPHGKEQFAVWCGKIVGSVVKMEKREPDSLIQVYRDYILHEWGTASVALSQLYPQFSWSLLIPDATGALASLDPHEKISTSALCLAELARQTGPIISLEPKSDRRLPFPIAESGPMIAFRLDDSELDVDVSNNVILGVSSDALQLADVAADTLFGSIKKACQALQFMLHKAEVFWTLSDLFPFNESTIEFDAVVESIDRASQIKELYRELAEIGEQQVAFPGQAELQIRFITTMDRLRMLQHMEVAEIENRFHKGLQLPFEEGERILAETDDLIAKYANSSTPD